MSSREVLRQTNYVANMPSARKIGVVLTAALAFMAGCSDDPPSPSTLRPIQPDVSTSIPDKSQKDQQDLTEEITDKTGLTAHTSLSDKEYPDKNVDIESDCVVMNSAEDDRYSWVIQNPLQTSFETEAGQNVEIAFGVLPIAERFNDGMLRFLTLSSYAIEGDQILGQHGSIPVGGMANDSVQLERTTRLRSDNEMPEAIIGHKTVYLKDEFGNDPPMANHIPGHVSYIPDVDISKFCILPEVDLPRM